MEQKGPMSEPPLVSVIVPVWNEVRRIGPCLEALLTQSLPREDYEIVVIDNGSTDGTQEKVRQHAGVGLIEERRPGSYAARNRGLAATRGAYVAFTDGDCIPDRRWLEEALIAARSDSRVGVVGGRIKLFDEGADGSPACITYEELFAFDQAANIRIGGCVTANWLSPRSAVEAAGGFDGERKSGGDFALARAIGAAGYRCVYAPEAVVWHPIRGSLDEHVCKCRRIVGGHWSHQPLWHRLPTISLLGLRVFVGRALHALFKPGLAPGQRLGVLRLVGILAAVWQLEAVRLLFGGEPQR